jgi:hypothetical protein
LSIVTSNMGSLLESSDSRQFSVHSFWFWSMMLQGLWRGQAADGRIPVIF